MDNITAGFALCGSFCTFEKAIAQITELRSRGADVVPIMSNNAFSTDTRFGKAADFVEKIEAMCEKKVISTLVEAFGGFKTYLPSVEEVTANVVDMAGN